ncbi:MAG: alkaline phosphatase [Bacteroidetes bacterium]|nr:alkaline phosphatase [Bacteroidota bacterium]
MKKTLFFVLLIGVFFAGCQQHSQTTQKQEKPAKNIILLIGDGMGTSQVFAGITANKGKLNIERFNDIGFSRTQSASDYITDSGAGGTAIAVGVKTYNGAIGVNTDTVPVKSILEYAEDADKATGLVATSTITHATPASFSAHQKSRHMYEEIAGDIVNNDIEVFIGGGLKHFKERKDSVDLTNTLLEKGYTMVYKQELIPTVTEGKLAGLLYEEAPPKFSEGRGDMLPLSSAKAIELLNQDANGFFLMIEGSQIDWGGHANDAQYIVDEMLDFDKAVGIALDFAEKDGNTLVIVTADHETGGMGLNGGDFTTGMVEGGFTTDNHTGVMVPVFAYGPQSDLFRGIYENTALFDKMMQAFGFEKK